MLTSQTISNIIGVGGTMAERVLFSHKQYEYIKSLKYNVARGSYFTHFDTYSFTLLLVFFTGLEAIGVRSSMWAWSVESIDHDARWILRDANYHLRNCNFHCNQNGNATSPLHCRWFRSDNEKIVMRINDEKLWTNKNKIYARIK